MCKIEASQKCEDLQLVKFENEQLKTKISQSQQQINNSQHVLDQQSSLLEYGNRSAQLPACGLANHCCYAGQNMPQQTPHINLNQVPNIKSSGNSRQKSPDNQTPEIYILNGTNVAHLPHLQQI